MSNRIVGIDIGSDSIKATFAETGFRSYTVVECREIQIPSPEEFPNIALNTPDSDLGLKEPVLGPAEDDFESDEESEGAEAKTSSDSNAEPMEPIPDFVFGLARFLQSPGVHFNEAAISIPGNYVSTHIIEMPFSDSRQIDQIIGSEIENYVPFDISQMVLSYQVIEKLEEGSRLLVSLVKNEDMETFLEHCALAGLDPAIVDIGPNALANAARLAKSEGDQRRLIVHIGGDQTDLIAMKGDSLTTVRSIPMGVRAATDGEPNLRPLLLRLRQTLQSIQAEAAQPFEQLEISGPLATNMTLVEKLSQDLGLHTQLFSPFSATFEKTVDDDDRTNSLFSKSLGIALRLTAGGIKGQINLRKGQFIYRRSGGVLKEELPKLIAMGAILLILLIYTGVYGYIQHKKEVEANREQITRVFKKLFPGQSVVNPVNQFRTNMETVYQKYKLVGYLGDGDLHAIDLIKAISESMPDNLKVDLKKMDITQDRVVIEGVTDNFEKVDRIETALKTYNGFKEIKKDQATKTANESIKFKFSIRIGEKSESALTGRRAMLKGGL